ncbi:MAG: hypothetical protein Q9193_002294, partial [Seirophora villosa]
GEMDGGVHLLGALVLPRGEALEVDDEELGRARDDDLLGGGALALAVRALPHLVVAQPFLLAVAAQAVVDVRRRRGVVLAPRRRRLLLLRDLDADAVEGFVGRGRVPARGAAQAARVLAREQVGDERRLAVRVAVPLDLGDFLDRHAFAHDFLLEVQRGERRLLPALVQVFVEAVQEEVEIFLGVLLAVDAPLRVQTRAELAESDGSDRLDVAFPQAADQVGVDLRHDAVGAFPVFDSEVAPSVVEKELGERDSGKETLDGGVRIAGDAEVDEAGAWKLQILGDVSGCV